MERWESGVINVGVGLAVWGDDLVCRSDIRAPQQLSEEQNMLTSIVDLGAIPFMSCLTVSFFTFCFYSFQIFIDFQYQKSSLMFRVCKLNLLMNIS